MPALKRQKRMPEACVSDHIYQWNMGDGGTEREIERERTRKRGGREKEGERDGNGEISCWHLKTL